MAEDGAVAGPGVFVQFFEILRQFSTQRVEMDIADKFQEIGIFLADDGFVAVLKKVATTFMLFVEGNRVSGHETAHDFAEWSRAGS